MRHCILIIALCGLAGTCYGQATAPASRPASLPASQPATAPDAAAVIAECVREIRDSARADQAGKAYARGCQANRQSAALHQAYMVRLLQLKQLALADYPAKSLNAIEPQNALAWAVSGYNAAKKGDRDQAFIFLLRAAVLNPKDKITLANAGQIMAWYEALEKPFRLNEEMTAITMKARKDLVGDPDFAEGADRVVKAIAAYKERLAAAAAAIEQAKAELSELRTTGRQAEESYADAKRNVDSLVASINRNNSALRDKDIDPTYADQLRSQNDELKDQLADERRTLEDLNSQLQKLRNRIEKKNREVNDLKKRPVPPVEYLKVFQWQPPIADEPTSQPTTAPSTTRSV